MSCVYNISMLQFLLSAKGTDTDYIVGLNYGQTRRESHPDRMHCFPLHSPLLRESWLVSIITLRRLICLSLARILVQADVPYIILLV